MRVAVSEVPPGDEEVTGLDALGEARLKRRHADGLEEVDVGGTDVLDADDLVDVEVIAEDG